MARGPTRAATAQRRPVPARVAPADRSALVAAVSAANGGAAATTLTMWADPAAPAAVAVGTRRPIYVESLHRRRCSASGSAQPRAFFRQDDRLASLARRQPARDARTGRADHRRVQPRVPLPGRERLLLWFPQNWTWRQVRTSRGSRAACAARRATSTGTTRSASGAPCRSSIVVLSGVVISYPWASDLVYRVAGEAPPARRGARRSRRRWHGARRRAAEPRGARPAPAGPRRGMGARGDAGRGMAQHQRPHPAQRRRDRGVHDRSRRRRPAAEARHADAERADRGGRSSGSRSRASRRDAGFVRTCASRTPARCGASPARRSRGSRRSAAPSSSTPASRSRSEDCGPGGAPRLSGRVAATNGAAGWRPMRPIPPRGAPRRTPTGRRAVARSAPLPDVPPEPTRSGSSGSATRARGRRLRARPDGWDASDRSRSAELPASLARASAAR